MKRIIRTIAKKGRQTEFSWRYGFNFFPSLSYKLSSSPKLSDVAARIVRDLSRNGIAISSVEELASELKYFPELSSSVEEILKFRKDELQQKKLLANNETTIGEKPFNVELLDSQTIFNPESVFAKFAVQETFLNIANGYFDMFVKLGNYNLWYTFATNAQARSSQLWHYDREDQFILKMFLYLDDVDEGAGPFTYAPQTHKKGDFNKITPKFFLEDGTRRSTDEQMDAVYPKEKWIKGTGKKGTIIFADTRGYHKGGEARTKDRIMFFCKYISQACESKRLLTNPNFEICQTHLTKDQLFAVKPFRGNRKR